MKYVIIRLDLGLPCYAVGGFSTHNAAMAYVKKHDMKETDYLILDMYPAGSGK